MNLVEVIKVVGLMTKLLMLSLSSNCFSAVCSMEPFLSHLQGHDCGRTKGV